MTAYIYHFSGESEGLRAHVRFNDVPLFDAEPDSPQKDMEDISLWVMPGPNNLEVSVSRPVTAPDVYLTAIKDPVEPPEDDEAQPRGPFFQARIQRAPRTDTSAIGTEWDFSWPPPGIRDLTTFYNLFELTCETPSQLWQQAEPLTLTEAVAEELRRFGEELHRVFSRGDHAALAQRMDFKGRDVGLVLGMTEAQGSAAQQRFFRAIMTRQGFKVPPWNADTVSVRLLANNTVAWLRDGTRPLLLSEQRQGMEVYVARIGGRWTVVR